MQQYIEIILQNFVFNMAANDVTLRFIEAYTHLIESGKITDKKEFAQKLGISTSMMTEISKGRSNVGITAIQNIVKYFSISSTWLLTGEGTMILSPNNTGVNVKETFTLRTDHNIASQSVPLYRITAQAGILALFDDTSSDIPIGQIQIPNLPRCDGALYVFGESMQPILQSGDIILYKKVAVDNILWGEMYLVAFSLDGDDYVAIKYIQKANDPQKVTLVSRNSSYAPQDIPWNSIRALALIKASIRFNTMG